VKYQIKNLDQDNIFNLRKSTIIITGAAGLLGSEYALGLSKLGANVVLADVDSVKCKILEKKIKTLYDTDPLSVKVDLTKKSSIIQMVSKTVKKYKKIDVLINNAAYQGDDKIRTTDFENLDLRYWKRAIDVNLTATFLCCQEVGKIMLKQQYGNIINIGSIYGVVAPDQRLYGKSKQNSAAFYASTKGAVISFTRYLASYWGRNGIRVNCVSPGGVMHTQDKVFQKRYSEKTMLGRMAEKDELLGAIVFLCSNASSYVTGSNLVVDGGWTAW